MSRTIASFRNKRAINPIIATLLLTVIVVVLAVTAWGFYSGYFATLMGGLQENISIDTASLDSATGTGTVYVRNKGDVSVNLSAIYVDGTQGWSGSQTISAGSSASFTVSGLTLVSGTSYNIKAVTDKGTETPYSAIAT